MFEGCPDVPNSFNVIDVVDNTFIEMEYADGFVSVAGNHTLLWDVQPTDRIEASGEMYHYRRGSWQPTPFSMTITDFCSVQFDPKSLWYQVWTRHIPKERRKCVNNYGHNYSYEPFTVDVSYESITNLEGRYKVMGYGYAYDENNKRRNNTICYQVIGEIYTI
ncbi:uncharacterized protein LOC133323880 [Musca vetustissima]|uniref:uncharacterized protein LOC133323880 n=1 Tax=Musca vetustissima TaxID=27455 RepID=UPI002AB74795|nr:uncharacterized protein LOC133323880 [Musca vetustissima]